MKKFLLFIIVISAGFGVFYYQETSICRNPITYDIGVFDERFNISKDKFLTTIKEAEVIWEKGIGNDLLTYQPGGKLKINLIFDEREAKTLEANQSEQTIAGTRESYNVLLSQYKILEASYKSDLSAYNNEASRFEKNLDAYNTRVASANKKGGATPKEYEELQKERQNLEYQKAEINRDQLTLNEDSAILNAQGDQLNELAGKLNIDVDIHNQRFGVAREFEQGQYSGKIDIFQFDTISDLRLVVAHELGHAFGLEHVENPESIMYYLMDKQDLNNPILTKEDKDAFLKRCTFHIPKLREIFN